MYWNADFSPPEIRKPTNLTSGLKSNAFKDW